MKLLKRKEQPKDECSVIKAHTELLVRHLDKDGNEIQRRTIKDRVVTTAFVEDLVDVLIATTADHDSFILYKWHDSGIGVATETTGDTAMGTACGQDLDAGTQVEDTTADTYKSVNTTTYASTFSITEHGLFNSSSGGTMMDRTVFSAVAVAANEKIEFTFTIQFTAGG